MSRLRGVLLGAGLMALACGGKSEIMPAPDTGGAGGTAATGGVGGGGVGGGGFGGGGFGGGGFGGGGFGGGGFGGGGFGGGGFGGGGFGGGGFGGGGFGGGGFGGVGGQPGLVQKLCDKLAMTCPLPGCVAELYDGLNMAAQYGCVPEYEKVLYCAIDLPITCDPSGEPQLSPQCQPALEAFSDCITGPSTCSASGGPGSCGIDCGFWGANCYEKGGYLYCLCTQGPKAGQSINLPGVSCGGNWDLTMEKFCAP